MDPRYVFNYDTGECEWIDEDGFSYDQGEYVFNYDWSEFDDDNDDSW